MPDGKIVFSTKIDNANVDKDLKRLEHKIRQAEESISKNKNAKLPLVNQANELGVKLDEAKAKAEMLRQEMAAINSAMAPGSAPEDYAAASADLPRVQAALQAQEKEVAVLQKQWDGVNNKIDGYDAKIRMAQDSITANTAKANELSLQMTGSGAKMSAAFASARAAAARFEQRIISLGKRILVFSVIASAFRAIKNYMDQLLSKNQEYTAQLAQLKAALATAFQPIYEFILPGLMAVLRILTSIANLAANVFSFFSGKTATQSAKNAEALNKEAEAIAAVGGAAKDAKKQLMGFDEINALSATEASAGGGGGSAGSELSKMDFSAVTDMSDDLLKILGIVTAIAAGLLTWKIAKSFTDSLSIAAGLALAVGGAFLYAFNWADAFTKGIDWENLSGMLLGMIALAGGLALAFGATGAAVGLVIGSVGLIIAALADFAKTGEVTDEMLCALAAGFLGIGAAIALLTGSWIPLAIGAVIALVTLLGLQFDGVRDAIGSVISWVLALWDSLVNFFNWLVRNWNAIFGSFSVIGGETVQMGPMPSVSGIPKLAQGAVLPANKPFLAMVGDQTHGTNVEAPLDTIKQALAEVMAEYGGGDIQINFTGDLAQLARILYPEIHRQNQNTGRVKGW